MQTDLIIVNEYCYKCQIEPSFIESLADEGLIEIRIIEDEKYFPVSQLPQLERYINWHYDLSINIAGIDTIQHLLLRIDEMKNEINFLKRKLNIWNSEI